MSSSASLPDDFSGPVRLFPLPDLVLFPSVVQPLHVFEPRYREMTADALNEDRLIAMATLKPNWQADYLQSPPIHSVICVGRIIKDEHLPDGRYNLLLHGLSRARIVTEMVSSKLYRQAKVKLLTDVPADTAVEQELRGQLSECLHAWFGSQANAREQLRKLLESALPLGTLCDVFSFTLDLDVELKQELLEQTNVEKRTRRLLEYLGPRLPDKTAAARPFPPPFSDN